MCRTLFGTVARTVFVTVLSLVGVSTLWAQGGLSVDTDFSPGEVGYYYVNMPATGTKEVTVPGGVLSFKVYDDGGKGGHIVDSCEVEDDPAPGDYSNNCNGYLKLTAPEGYLLKFFGMICIESDQAGGKDYLTAFDGADTGETARRLIDRLCSSPYEGGEPDNIGQYDDWPRRESVKPVVSTGHVVTLYFCSDGSNRVEGLDLTVTLVPVGQVFSISSTEVTGGAVTAQAEAKPHDEVTLTTQPAAGYMLAAVSVKDGDGFDVGLADGLLWYSPAQSTTFHMPADEVTVTPTFTNTWTAEGGLYINMPWKGTRTAVIPSSVRSFKVYDDGGEGGNALVRAEHPDNGGNYRNNCDGYLELTAPEGYVLQLSGTISSEAFHKYSNHPDVTETDWLDVYDGTRTSDKLLNKVHSAKDNEPININTVTSSAERMTLYFHSNDSWCSDGLDLKVEVIPSLSAKHLVKISAAAGGTVTSNVTKEQKDKVVTLTVTPDEGYVLSSLDVVDDWGQPVSLAGDTVWYSTGTPPSFVMPVHGVTVIPHFTSQLTAEGGLSVDMPLPGNSQPMMTIPAGVQSFKVYDSGYKGWYKTWLQLTAPEDYVLKLTIQDMSGRNQYISVYDGSYEDVEDAPILLDDIPDHWNDEGELVIDEPDEHATVYGTNREMTIKYYGNPDESSFEFLVTLVDARDAHTVHLTEVEGGSVQASATSAKVGTLVTLTATPDEGYLLTGIDVTDAHGDRRIPKEALSWCLKDNVTTFIMPVADVTVTPHFTKTLTAEGGLYINMPTTGTLDVEIPAGVQSFKVYDNGGEGGTNVEADMKKGPNYALDSDGYLKLTAPEGYVLQLSGQITLEEDWDFLTVYDGDADSRKLVDCYTGFPDDGDDSTAPTCDIPTMASTGRTMTLHMTSDDEFCFAGLDLTVTLLPAVTLLDNDSESDTKNTDVMAAAQEMETPYAVVLKDRQMTKNGEWNTLCLPFGVTDGDEDDELSFTGTPLEGAIVRELDADNSNLSADGVLTLTFKEAERIEAGKPYIVKWTVEGSAGENDDEVQPLINPVFCGVTIARTEPVAVTFANAQGSACSFVGQFAPFAIDADNQKEVLMLTTGNRIGYTASDRMLRAFRAHFDVPAVSGQARRFVLDFGDSAQGDATKLDDKSIRSVDNATDTWYDLQGRRLNGEPKRKGLYIKNRKKVKQNL